MADIGLFSRLGNLWRGFLSLWIADIEKEHPEIAYENAINSMVEKYTKLKNATAAIIRRREDVDSRFKAATKELAQTEAELGVAVETNQDDLAVVLIQKKNQLNAELTELRQRYAFELGRATRLETELDALRGACAEAADRLDAVLADG